MNPELHPLIYDDLLRRALAEDLGLAGDLTTDAVVPRDTRARFVVRARMPGVAAGLGVARSVFALVDPDLEVVAATADGDPIQSGDELLSISGRAGSILTGERTALNLLGRLSGIATATREVVDAIAGTGAAVACTRKTTPGLRALEKYAVRLGGGSNHRFGLDDAVLIKDNHLAVAGSVTEAVRRVRGHVGHVVKIEVEVDDIDQLVELLEVGADIVLLDNFAPQQLREAVALVNGAMVTEASGGITPESARSVAECGVDLLSIGWLTHSAAQLDVGLDAG